MTREFAKSINLSRLIAGWEAGGQFQTRRGISKWNDASLAYVASIFDNEQVRIKPTTKLRAWKPEEIPVGAILRQKANHANKTIISGVVDGRCFIGTWEISHNFEAATCEHSTDGGMTWKECGVMTEE